jgi:hypothetical protein
MSTACNSPRYLQGERYGGVTRRDVTGSDYVRGNFYVYNVFLMYKGVAAAGV